MAVEKQVGSHPGDVPMTAEDVRPRATRYEFGAVIRYRRVGETVWREGWTINVSRSGVLFTGPPPVLENDTPLEMVIVLPDFGAVGASRIRGTGRIVRTVASSPDRQIAMAATIDQYRFLKPDEAASFESDVDPHRQ